MPPHPNVAELRIRTGKISRREFALRSTGAFLVLLGVESAGSIQARPQKGESHGSDGGSWLPKDPMLQELPRLLELAGVPGLAVAVVENEQIWKRGFGRADVAFRTGVSDETVFEAASLGKPLFALAVLRLADSGVLDLDRPLYDYLPLPETEGKRMRRVTARHVLGQSTGLPNWRVRPGPLEPGSDPGKEFSYSGEGIFYLQRVVERLTDRPFARYMDETMLQPLGMRRSSYVWSAAFESRMAAGYDEHGARLDVYAEIGRKAENLARQWGKPMLDWRFEDSARAVPLVSPEWPALPVFMVPNAAASFLTTAEDYARFLSHLVTRSEGAGFGLSEATERAIATAQVRLNSALSWGLGWGLERGEGTTYLWQWGANLTFRNFVIVDREARRAVAVFTNSTNGSKVYERVITTLTGRDHPAFLWFAV